MENEREGSTETETRMADAVVEAAAAPANHDQAEAPANPTETVHRIVQSEIGRSMKLSADAVRVVWETICKDATGPELWMFLTFCKMKGLNPLLPGQAHFAAWTDSRGNRNRMIMAGIHGLRYMVARDMKDNYRPGINAIERDGEGRPLKAIVTTWRRTGGEWYEHREERHWSDYEYLWSSPHHPAWKNWPADKFLEATEARLLRRVFPEPLGDVYLPDEVVIDVGVTPTGAIVPAKKAGATSPVAVLLQDAARVYKERGVKDPRSAAIKLLRAAVPKDSVDWTADDVATGRRAVEELAKPSKPAPTETTAEEPPAADDQAQPTGSSGDLFGDTDSPKPATSAKPTGKLATEAELAPIVQVMRGWAAECGAKAPPAQDRVVVAYFHELGVEGLKAVPATLLARIKKAADTETVFKTVAHDVLRAEKEAVERR